MIVYRWIYANKMKGMYPKNSVDFFIMRSLFCYNPPGMIEAKIQTVLLCETI